MMGMVSALLRGICTPVQWLAVRPVQVNTQPCLNQSSPQSLPAKDLYIYEIQNSLFMTSFLNLLSLNRFLMLTFYPWLKHWPPVRSVLFIAKLWFDLQVEPWWQFLKERRFPLRITGNLRSYFFWILLKTKTSD